MGLFDVHAHLTDSRLLAQEGDVIARAVAAGISCIISNGLNPSDNERVLALSQRHAIVKPAFGFYPVDTVLPEMRQLGVDYPGDGVPCSSDEGIRWVREHIDEAFAVGEIGLDGYWVPKELWPKQDEVFQELVQIAMNAQKVIIVHSRKRERDCFEQLTSLGTRKVIWHCFSSKVKLGLQIGQAGHYLSIPANAVRAEGFQRLLEKLPREQVLFETDCPYLCPIREQLNEPANILHTLTLTAKIWGCSEAEVQAQLEENFTRLFGVAP